MTPPCPYCKTEAPLYFQSRDYNRHITQEIFDHYCCPQCGLIFIEPIPGCLSDYYPETYHSIPATTTCLERASKHELFKIEIVQRYIREGRLLEIGPSYGSFTYLAKKAGFEVDAIEMDAPCCKFLNEVIGVQAINSTDPAHALQSLRPYDVIALWHVIEHLPDPWSVLDAILKKIKPGGILVIASVNPEAFQFRILGRYWLHLDAPRHVMLIPTTLLTDKLEALGLKLEMLTTTDKGTIACNFGGWRYFFLQTCTQRFSNKVLLFILRPLMGLIGRGVGHLVVPIERIDGKGSAYTMVFRKN
jgi:2-polyprenyl-3-methyl-5-hydroxy-6-metoxy-1,4-benzoquinol methylase